MRTNWCSAEEPPITAWSPMLTCPPMTTLLATITQSPSVQSCATCVTAISRQSAPTRVTPEPVTVPRWMVQCSRNWVRGPITVSVGSPRYFRSCGAMPTVQNG